jgi:predicted nucleic acid-binding protein
MKVLLDTSVLIDAQRGAVDLDRWLEGFEAVAIPAAAVAEFLVGIHSVSDDRRRANGLRFYNERIEPYFVAPFDHSAAVRHGELVGSLRKQGISLQPFDAMIAATALDVGAAVGSSNASDFARVPGLTVVSPMKRGTPDPGPLVE